MERIYIGDLCTYKFRIIFDWKNDMEKLLVLFISIMGLVCNAQITTGAEQFNEYIDTLRNKRVGMIVNQTSIIGKSHLVDTLKYMGIEVVKIFTPEHGFRGDADAGEHIKSGIDEKTQLPVVSLYGENKKPSSSQLADVDILVFDVQDVGCRFYTYLSTMVYAMEACAENNKKLVILDRPNPNGKYIDGPTLDLKFKSFVGVLPIPVLYGMTLGEMAQMVNGEKWLGKNLTAKIQVVKLDGYTHETSYSLPIKPSPNLPNDQAIRMYPSLCFFEGTKISVGRGTDYAFQTFGHPSFKKDTFEFYPKSVAGAKNPMYKNQLCKGMDLRTYTTEEGITLRFIMIAYARLGGDLFDNISFFDKLAGTDKLRKMLIAHKSEKEIRKSWQKDLNSFRDKRKKYLLYQ